MDGLLHFFCDEFFVFRGVVFARGFVFHETGAPPALTLVWGHAGQYEVPESQMNLPSPGVALRYGELHANCRFDVRLPVFPTETLSDVGGGLKFLVRYNGRAELIEAPASSRVALDPFVAIGGRFLSIVSSKPGSVFLEIGARARSGATYWQNIRGDVKYIGFDIIEGPNVDVVGDAHELSSHFAPGSVDFVCSNSTFEHLAMPWKAVLEINRVLKTGGFVYLVAPQTWPTHDEPWDFFRFSKYAWACLFNAHTGFEIVSAEQGLPSHVLPALYLPGQILDNQPGWLMSAVIARKVSDTALNWQVPTSAVVSGVYPG
jgi:SAM-dependent methyltransferase